MSELIPFDYGDKQVRTVQIDGEAWFVAADVCAVLGIRNVATVVGALDDDERGTVVIADTPNGLPVSIVSEPGLYSIILRSRKPEAKPFRRWVTHEVIPTVRRTGQYAAPTVVEPSSEPVPRDHFDAMRAMAVAHVAMIDELARQDRSLRVVEVQVTQLDERVAAIESSPNWRTSTGWAQQRGWAQTDIPTLGKLGKRAAKIAKAHGLEESKVPDINGRFMVNRWPLVVWDQAAAELGWQVAP